MKKSKNKNPICNRKYVLMTYKKMFRNFYFSFYFAIILIVFDINLLINLVSIVFGIF